MKIGIFLFEGVDILDAGGPYEVFLTASRLVERTGEAGPFEVITLTGDGQPVRSYGGMGVVPHQSVNDCGPLDAVVIPGTIDLEAAEKNPELLSSIDQLASKAALTTSVCTGAFLLAAVGLLEHKPWTTHWEDIDALGQRTQPEGARTGVRWVDAGNIITSAGLSAGIDMALHLVDRLVGTDLALQTAHQLDHRWDPDPKVSD